MEEEVPSGSDNIVAEFATYEEFLDSHIKPIDLFYLEVGNGIIINSESWLRSYLKLTTLH